eukprot:scaffold10016_cov54-Attheya_sp.AAC.2
MVGLNTDRKANFKKGIDAAECRRGREDTQIRLRKNKKEESLAKRRNLANVKGPAENAGVAVNQTGVTATKRVFTEADIPMLLPGMQNLMGDKEVLLESVRGFRRMLSLEINPPVAAVMNCGALPLFVQMLNLNDHPTIQFEAAWALTNVASTEFTSKVVEANALPALVALLRSPDADVREQCAWCLGNIAGDSPPLRDTVLNCGAMEPLLLNIENPATPAMLQNMVWALSNFCRGKPQPDLHVIAPAVPHLSRMLTSNNQDAIVDACWALSYLCDGSDDRIQLVQDSGATEHLVSLLSHESASVVTPALRCLGNFVSGSDRQTQAVVDAGVLDKITGLLASSKKTIKKETCWLLSNIAAGTRMQIASLIAMPQVLSVVIHYAQTAEWEIRKEATWVVSNIATMGSGHQVKRLVELGAIDAICSILDITDARICLVALDAMESILKSGSQLGLTNYPTLVDEADGLEKLESLQGHANVDIYEKSIALLEMYFGVEDEVEDENLAPVVTGNTFGFGVQEKAFEWTGSAEDEAKWSGALGDEASVPALQPFSFNANNMNM